MEALDETGQARCNTSFARIRCKEKASKECPKAESWSKQTEEPPGFKRAVCGDTSPAAFRVALANASERFQEVSHQQWIPVANVRPTRRRTDFSNRTSDIHALSKVLPGADRAKNERRSAKIRHDLVQKLQNLSQLPEDNAKGGCWVRRWRSRKPSGGREIWRGARRSGSDFYVSQLPSATAPLCRVPRHHEFVHPLCYHSKTPLNGRDKQ
mmetsp:Transcript_19005/g.46670  ORF Transcript_19005/g.46670 Transcript_19005/m.46670 type:complete len:211 (+) Transcript_19005:1734-2366(+)